MICQGQLKFLGRILCEKAWRHNVKIEIDDIRTPLHGKLGGKGDKYKHDIKISSNLDSQDCPRPGYDAKLHPKAKILEVLRSMQPPLTCC